MSRGSGVVFFERLRPDEIARVARRFTRTTLAAGERLTFEATLEAARLVVVVRGRARLEVDSPAGTLHIRPRPGRLPR